MDKASLERYWGSLPAWEREKFAEKFEYSGFIGEGKFARHLLNTGRVGEFYTMLGKHMRAHSGWRVFNPLATKEDIEYCFRILLGRFPSEQEIEGHFSRVGAPLNDVVSSFLGSHEFWRRGLHAPAVQDVALVKGDGFSLYVNPQDLATGKDIARGVVYEPHVTEAMKAVLRKGNYFVDIGANVGYFSMLGASLVGAGGAVDAIEPNPDNIKLLKASALENRFENINLVQAALSDRVEVLALHRDNSNGAVGVVPTDAVGRVLASETVQALRFDDIVRNGRPVDVIKIDVEGFEYRALKGAERTIREHKPAILSEFTPLSMETMSGCSPTFYLDWLRGFGYSIAVLAKGKGMKKPESNRVIMDHFGAAGVDHIDIIAWQ